MKISRGEAPLDSRLSNIWDLPGQADTLIYIVTTVAFHWTGYSSRKNLHNFCKLQISLKWKLFMFCWPVLGWPCCTSHQVVVVPSICTLIFRILAAVIWFGRTHNSLQKSQFKLMAQSEVHSGFIVYFESKFNSRPLSLLRLSVELSAVSPRLAPLSD